MRLIDADSLDDVCTRLNEDGWGITRGEFKLMDRVLFEFPNAERKGKWLEMGTNKDGTHNIKCSKCGEGYKTRGHARSIATKAKYNFCPNCGADMR